MVNTQDDGNVLAGGRRGDNDFLSSPLQMCPGLVGAGEEPGRFNDDLNPVIPPGYFGRVTLGENL